VTLARQLAQALADVADALESGGIGAAAPAADRVARLVSESVAAGGQVTPDELRALRQAQARAEAATTVAREGLLRGLELASTGRRATLAYGA
jgi:hypothetical protein